MTRTNYTEGCSTSTVSTEVLVSSQCGQAAGQVCMFPVKGVLFLDLGTIFRGALQHTAAQMLPWLSRQCHSKVCTDKCQNAYRLLRINAT